MVSPSPGQCSLHGESGGDEMEATNGRMDWARLYSDSIEHLLWNPTWIRGRQADGSPMTVRMVMKKLRGLEAPLHHAVHMFFTLAPAAFLAKLLGAEPVDLSDFQVACCPEWDHVSTGGKKTASILELCQPDIFVECGGTQIAIEIKAKSKSSLEQVLKYAAFMLVRRPNPSSATRRLIFLAPYESFAEFWTGRAYADPDSLKDALRKFSDPNVDRKFRRFGTSLDAVKASLDDLRITWRSVRDVRRDVREELKVLALKEPSDAGEVYHKLLSGFEKELLRWQDGD
jgi:hypothetical protein